MTTVLRPRISVPFGRATRSQRALLDLAIGAALAGAGLLLRFILAEAFAANVSFLTFFPMIALAASVAGFIGGASALIVSVALVDWFILAPQGSLETELWLELLLFSLAGGVISALGGQLHSSRAVAERARAAAELARERASFLADASAVLGERLDRLATVDALTRVAVPRFADWCAIDLFDDEGRFLDARIAAPDAEKVELAQSLRREYPYVANAAAGVAAVFQRGVPEVVLEMPTDFMAIIPDARLRQLMEGLAFRSYISVPMSVPDGRRIGVLTVVMSESGRRFTAEDVETAADLGRRAGVALDHATLFGQVAERRDELDAVIRAIDDPILVAGPDGRIRSHNPAAAAVLGDVLGQSFDAVIAALADVDGHPGIVHVEPTGRYLSPVVFDLEVSAPTTRIAVLRDVTALLDSEAARDAFVSMLSHELRTPITTIFGTAQVLRRPLDERDRANLVDDLASETDRLHRLVEDLLVLSRFERGRLEISPEPILVQRVVSAAMHRATSVHPGLQVTVVAAPGLPAALADATYLEQVIRNLASNAVKYAGETAQVEVRVRADGDQVRVEFEDDGPGVPDHERDRVFALFERLGRSSFQPGAGVGLFVCRQLLEAMGGEISVRRGAGGGACFEFGLPALREELAMSPSGSGERELEARSA